jgi:nucleoside-diphosphate-sugar epimerase
MLKYLELLSQFQKREIMNIFITGGAGDLGLLLARDLDLRGDVPIRLDIRPPQNLNCGKFISGSILDRNRLSAALTDVDYIVHVAAWHGIHLVTGQKNIYDFWDLNVTGTFNVFQAAAEKNIRKVIYISSTSVLDRFGIYGHTKVLGEEIARTYHEREQMQVIILRPGAFIPWWNTSIYKSYLDWAKWYWKGAVHINDVLQATLKAIDYLKGNSLLQTPTLFIDGKYEYSSEDLEHWDVNGAGTTFNKYYAAYADIVAKYGLDPAQKPETFDIAPAKKLLGYQPTYSFMNLLLDLKTFAEKGPLPPNF